MTTMPILALWWTKLTDEAGQRCRCGIAAAVIPADFVLGDNKTGGFVAVDLSVLGVARNF